MNARAPRPKLVPMEPAPTASIEFYRAADYAPEQSVGHLMRQILVSVAQEVEHQLHASDLTNAQWVPMFKLYMGQARTVAELARECKLDAGAMTRLLDRLEAKGLCRRVRSSSDRRVVNIELTDEGLEAARVIPDAVSRVHNAHLAGFTQVEWETLKQMLRRILGNAKTIQEARGRHAD